jgi:hypothetical protein
MRYSVIVLLLTGALSSGLQAESAVVPEETLALGHALSDEDLAGQRGEGADVLTLNQVDIDGNNQGNSVAGSVTGSNLIGNTAFNGANGMFDIIQNTGNNVLIQKATIVNINVMD